jgi:hypothetical protein
MKDVFHKKILVLMIFLNAGAGFFCINNEWLSRPNYQKQNYGGVVAKSE